MSSRQDLLPYEILMQSHLAHTGVDLNAQAAVFNLDHAAMDVIATMEGLALRPHHLSHAGFVVLMTLWITGPRQPRELAAVLRVTRGAIVGSVNTLEKRGLVRRIHSKLDRRLVTVQLTDSGLNLVTRAQKDWHALEVEVTAGLTLDEQRAVARILRKMAAGARALRSDRNGHIEPLNPALFLSKAGEMPKRLTPSHARR